MGLAAFVLFVTFASLYVYAQEAGTAMRGFSHAEAEEQRRIEDRFKRIPSPESCEKHLRILTEEPHIAGSAQTRAVVNYISRRLREYGFEPEIVEYHVYLPYPKATSLEMLEPRQLKTDNKEDGFEIDKDSYDSNVPIPFNGYSPSGEAIGQLVYANYGREDDYRKLDQMGIDLKGKIVIARYGRNFRGLKVRSAEERGAIGLILYSDPQDDGYAKGDIYPRGPWRPWSGVQRGSVMFISQYPGDPLTPGIAATKDAKRLKPEEAKNLPKIPVMPISYRDASPLLESLAGPVVPRDWQGGLPFTYHIGPGPTKVRMKVEMDYAVRPIWNVIATMEGSQEPDKVIVLGNHHDAWTYGAVDPSSGTTALLEVARGLGELLKQGFRPKRTLVLAVWDGEEYGLLGSTEWGEDKAEWLKRNCVAYINVDSAVSGENFNASAVGSLKNLIRDVAKEVEDPKRYGKSVYQVWLERRLKELEELPEEQQKEEEQEVRIGVLGSGSDYTVFLDHLGIPSISMSFGGDYGVYHAIYDNFTWMKLFGDPTWRYHATMAKIWGVMALRLANAAALPFDYAEYGKDIERFVKDIEKRLRREAERTEAAKLDLNPIREEAKRMVELGNQLNLILGELSGRKPVRLKAVNEKLIQVERDLTDARGLPRRPWFKHLIYAPGYHTGYAAKPLPGVAEAVEEKDWQTAQEQIQILAAALKRANATLGAALQLAQQN